MTVHIPVVRGSKNRSRFAGGGQAAPARGLDAGQIEEKRPAGRFTGFRSTYFACISATVVSSMRLLKPHSLSYHEQTFTSLPSMTFVKLESYSDDAGL